MLIACGILVNGPYCLITTAVSADLGNHPSLKGLETSFCIQFTLIYKQICNSVSVYYTILLLIHLHNATIQDHLVITMFFMFEVFRVIKVQDQTTIIENKISVYSIHCYVAIV